MALLYKLHQDNRTIGTKLFYARAVQIATLDTDALAERVQANCSMKKSDVKAVIEELIDVMTSAMQESYTVKLDGFGSFKLGITSSGASSEKSFTVQENIKQIHVNFLPTGTKDRATNKVTRTFAEGCKVKRYDQI